jgi:acetyl esterase/lipase
VTAVIVPSPPRDVRVPSVRRPAAGVGSAAAALALLAATACGVGSGTDGSGSAGRSGADSHEYLPGLEAYPYLPEGDVDSAPVVVLIPGGSWESAEPAGLQPLAAALAEKGVVAVPVTIRAARDDVVYPTPVEDVLCAAADAAATAREAGIEPERLVLLGHSSGGHLSAVATLAAQRFTPRCEDPVVEPDGLVGLAGPYDVRQFADAAEALFGASPEEARAEWEAANPVIQAGLRPDVPVLLLHGEADDVVPASFTTDFAAALQAGGHPTTARILPGEDHDTIYSAETAAGPVVDWLETLP